jgi:hypothetical protein
MAQARSSTPFDLEICNPDLHRIALARAFRMQCEMHELFLITKETVAATRAMIAEADRILAEH